MLRRVAAGAALVLAAAVAAGRRPHRSAGLADPASASSSADDALYRPGGSYDAKAAKVRVSPTKYSLVQVDAAPRRRRAAQRAGRRQVRLRRQTFRVPTPTGGFERFAVQRTQAMESELAAAHPEIGTWSGVSLDHPGTTIALDVTPMGFHASVRGRQRSGSWLRRPGVQPARHDHAPQLLPRGRRPVRRGRVRRARGARDQQLARRAARSGRRRARRSSSRSTASR